ncbi:MAG: hypothetical protein M5U28_27945 [Sandaracinaceae bacterium]|nr:hypothetical protein [Sandaracinaceae bacterium]
MDIDWSDAPAKTREVYAYLKACASQMRTVHYGEIAEHVGLAAAGMGVPLRFIRDEVCRKHGFPWLNALAVSADDWRPGKMFLPEGVDVDRDEELLWRGMVLQVFVFDWESIR